MYMESIDLSKSQQFLRGETTLLRSAGVLNAVASRGSKLRRLSSLGKLIADRPPECKHDPAMTRKRPTKGRVHLAKARLARRSWLALQIAGCRVQPITEDWRTALMPLRQVGIGARSSTRQ